MPAYVYSKRQAAKTAEQHKVVSLRTLSGTSVRVTRLPGGIVALIGRVLPSPPPHRHHQSRSDKHLCRKLLEHKI